jgi:hypothetical protein
MRQIPAPNLKKTVNLREEQSKVACAALSIGIDDKIGTQTRLREEFTLPTILDYPKPYP